MKNIFKVKIHYADSSTAEVNVIAKNDILARDAAVKIDSQAFKDNLQEPPKIAYCEISRICIAFSA
jgi:hypothetical protein